MTSGASIPSVLRSIPLETAYTEPPDDLKGSMPPRWPAEQTGTDLPQEQSFALPASSGEMPVQEPCLVYEGPVNGQTECPITEPFSSEDILQMLFGDYGNLPGTEFSLPTFELNP